MLSIRATHVSSISYEERVLDESNLCTLFANLHLTSNTYLHLPSIESWCYGLKDGTLLCYSVRGLDGRNVAWTRTRAWRKYEHEQDSFPIPNKDARKKLPIYYRAMLVASCNGEQEWVLSTHQSSEMRLRSGVEEVFTFPMSSYEVRFLLTTTETWSFSNWIFCRLGDMFVGCPLIAWSLREITNMNFLRCHNRTSQPCFQCSSHTNYVSYCIRWKQWLAQTHDCKLLGCWETT